MGNTASGLLHVRGNPKILYEVLNLKCLNEIRYNKLYFALDLFTKLNKDQLSINSSIWSQVQGKIHYCMHCEKAVMKDIEPKYLIKVRKIAKDLLNMYADGSTREVVQIGDTVNNNQSASSNSAEFNVSNFANRTVNMRGFVMFFRTFIQRFHLVIDEMAVKWALTEYLKLSKDEQIEYNRMKLCICHIMQRSTGNRSCALRENQRKQDSRSVANSPTGRNQNRRFTSRSMITLRNDLNYNQNKNGQNSRRTTKPGSQRSAQPRKTAHR